MPDVATLRVLTLLPTLCRGHRSSFLQASHHDLSTRRTTRNLIYTLPLSHGMHMPD